MAIFITCILISNLYTCMQVASICRKPGDKEKKALYIKDFNFGNNYFGYHFQLSVKKKDLIGFS